MQEREATAGDLLDQATRRLRATGSASPRLDALLLLGRALALSKTDLLAHPERVPDARGRDVFGRLVDRRAAHEPMAYILGEREFYGRPFRTDRRALVPRPETEALVELGVLAVQAWLKRGVQPRVVDVGTGSGAVAVSVAAETGVAVVGTDRSWAALALAQENARALGQAERVRLVQADLLATLAGPIHVLLANLPYLPASRRHGLAPDVRDYEPAGAFFGGTAGTEAIERLLREGCAILAPGATILLELDEGQGERMAALARNLYRGASADVLRDAANLERVVRVVVPPDGLRP